LGTPDGSRTDFRTSQGGDFFSNLNFPTLAATLILPRPRSSIG